MVRFATLLAVAALAAPAHASSTVYLDRVAWEAAVSGSLYTETFDGVPDQSIPMFVGGVLYTPGFDIVIPGVSSWKRASTTEPSSATRKRTARFPSSATTTSSFTRR